MEHFYTEWCRTLFMDTREPFIEELSEEAVVRPWAVEIHYQDVSPTEMRWTLVWTDTGEEKVFVCPSEWFPSELRDEVVSTVRRKACIKLMGLLDEHDIPLAFKVQRQLEQDCA